MSDVQQVFSDIFENKSWGPGESVSGPGSSRHQTHHLIHALPRLLAEFGVKSMLDLPCGDYNWMQYVNLDGIDYQGGDIVEELIARNKNLERPGVRFEVMNILTSELPKVDLIFTRDCLVHLSLSQVIEVLRNVKRSGATWFLTTTFPGHETNPDIRTGDWRPLNLELAPLSFPRPERYLFEFCSESNNQFRDKCLGLWRVDSIPV